MKKFFFLITVIFASVACKSGDEAGSLIPFADPFILSDNGLYYMYGTGYDDGIGVVVSDNLKTWHVPDYEERWLVLHKDDSFGDHGFWAPEVYHIGNDYYLYYSSEEHICVAVSDSPLGPFVQKVQEPMLEDNGIDNTLFIDDDGTPYMFWVRFNNGNEIWSAQLESDMCTIKQETMSFCTRMSQPWEEIWPAVNEGPAVVRKNGVYYMAYSANHFMSQDYAIGYATTDNIGGTWEKYSGNPVLRRPEGLFGVGHHSFFKDFDGNDRIVFHSHHDEENVGPRIIHISYWGIDADGHLYIDEDRISTPTLR